MKLDSYREALMPFHVVCARCQEPYELPDAFRGKRVRCKSCKETFLAEPGPAAAVQQPEEILDVLPAQPGDGDQPAGRAPEPGRRRAWGDEDDGPRPPSGRSAGLVIALAVGGTVALVLLLIFAGAALWLFGSNRAAPVPPPGPVAATARAPVPVTPQPPQPAPPVAWRVQADPGPTPPPVPSGRQRIPIPGNPDHVSAVFPATPSSRVLLLSGLPRRATVAEVWDLNRMARANRFGGFLSPETPMALSPDGTYFAARPDGTSFVSVYRTDTGAEVQTCHGGWPSYAAFASGTRLLIGRGEGKARRYEQIDMGGLSLPAVEVKRRVEEGGEAISPGGRYLAVLGDNKVSIYELSDGSLVGEISLLPLAPAETAGLLVGLAFSPDGRQLAVLRSKTDGIEIYRHDLVANRPGGGVILDAAAVHKLGAARQMPGERLQWLPGRDGWLVHGTFCVEPGSRVGPVLVPGRKGNTAVPVMLRVVDAGHIAVLNTQSTPGELALVRVPAEELAGRPAPPDLADQVPPPPEPPAAKEVDWSGVETVPPPDAKEAQGIPADPAPDLMVTPRRGPFPVKAHANDVHAVLFPRARAQAVVVSSRPATEGKRVVTAERLDLVSGLLLGTLPLYARTVPNPIYMYAPSSAVSPDGNLFAQIDINGRQRIDVWSLKDGKHVVGFLAPPGAVPGAEVGDRPRGRRGAGDRSLLARDVAFVDAEHLLTLVTPSNDSAHGQVVLWKLPEAKPVYQFRGTDMPWLSLSPGGKYLAADTPTGYALLEARTGKVVGRLPFPPKDRVVGVNMAGFRRDGTRFAAVIVEFGHGPLPDHRLVWWDLAGGTLTDSFTIQMPMLTRGIQWFGDSTVFVGWRLFSLEYKRELVHYAVPPGLATTSPDGRLWYVTAPDANQSGSLYARTMPDDAARKVTEAFRDHKPVPFNADFVSLSGEK